MQEDNRYCKGEILHTPKGESIPNTFKFRYDPHTDTMRVTDIKGELLIFTNQMEQVSKVIDDMYNLDESKQHPKAYILN